MQLKGSQVIISVWKWHYECAENCYKSIQKLQRSQGRITTCNVKEKTALWNPWGYVLQVASILQKSISVFMCLHWWQPELQAYCLQVVHWFIPFLYLWYITSLTVTPSLNLFKCGTINDLVWLDFGNQRSRSVQLHKTFFSHLLYTGIITVIIHISHDSG